MTPPPAATLTATDLGEFVRHHSCDRRFHLAVHEGREVTPLPFFDRLRDAIDPVLAEVGRRREDQWQGELDAAGFRDLAAGLPKGERDEVTWAALATALGSLPPGVGGYARQVAVGGTVGAFRVYGLVDFLVARWDGDAPRLTLVECKASRRDRTYHRVQVAAYRTLLRGLLGGEPVAVGGGHVPPDAVECVVGRLPEADYAFVDEVWKASSAILNCLLKILNERVYDAGDGVARRVPLRLCVGASNEWPSPDTGKELSALLDRFLLRKSQS